jgi:hypothetical protein
MTQATNPKLLEMATLLGFDQMVKMQVDALIHKAIAEDGDKGRVLAEAIGRALLEESYTMVMMRAMDGAFTEEELDANIQFYSSSIGKSTLSKMSIVVPKLTVEMSAILDRGFNYAQADLDEQKRLLTGAVEVQDKSPD